MLRIDRNSKTLKKLDHRSMPESGLREREDIQRMIRDNSDAFFADMGERLLLIGEEVRPTEQVEDRIDLLAIDPEGAATIIELKRRDHKLHLLQALTYAGMVSKWKPDRFVDERSKLLSKPRAEAQDDVEQHLEDLGTLNQSQRIILIAEGFDWEVLVTAEWLCESYQLDIRCFRLNLAVDGAAEYLTCVCVYPPPELTEQAARRRLVEKRPSRWADWDAALAGTGNPALATFFRDQLAGGTEGYLRKRTLHFRINGKRVCSVVARRKHAYVWQHGRFPGDENFWVKRLGAEADIKPVKDGRRLRFSLETATQFDKFREALSGDLPRITFVEAEGDDVSQDDPLPEA